MVEVKNCLQESQKNFSSHPQFITEIRAQHKDPKPFLKDLFRYLKRIFFIEKQTVPLKRVLKFVARIATFPTTDHNGRNWVDVYSSGLILFCLKFTKCSNKTPKLRSLELIGVVLNDLPDDFALSETVYNALFKSVYPLLKDPLDTVRLQAIASLSRLQQPQDPNDKITSRLNKMLTGDPSKKVREACLRNIGIINKTLPDVLTRTRDSSELVRRSAYTLMKEKLGIKSLSISQRNNVLRNGLRDRNEDVRKECSDMLLNFWLPSCGSVLEFLSLIDVEENETDATIITEHIAEKHEMDTKSNPPFTGEVDNEKAFLWKIICAQINKQKPINWTKLDSVLINPRDFAKTLEDNISNHFIFKQLLGICKYLDFKDESNRNFIIDKAKTFLINLNVSNEFVALVTDITRPIFRSESDHAKSIVKIILKLLENFESDSKHVAKEKKIEMETLVYTRILELIKDMLRFSKIGTSLPDIRFIKEKLILPCVTRDNPFIRAPAIEALALYCYFDSDEARKYIVLLFHVLKKDQEALKLIALKSIIDLLLIHSDLAQLKTDSIDENAESGLSESSIVDALSSFLGSDDEVMMYTAVEGFAKLITVGRVREVKPISMCILLLFNPNSSDEEPIQQCLSLFFSSFLLLKGKNFANNARLFAKAFLPTIKIILHAPLSSPLSKISVQQFSNWTFSFFPENHQDFTDKDCYEKHKETIDQIRASLTKFILNEILKNDFKNEKDNAEALIFSKLLLPIRLVPDNKEIAKIVKRIIKKLEDENCDKFVKINLRRFIRSNSIK